MTETLVILGAISGLYGLVFAKEGMTQYLAIGCAVFLIICAVIVRVSGKDYESKEEES